MKNNFEYDKTTDEDVLFGKLLVQQGLITQEQLDEMLGLQKELAEKKGMNLRLGELLLRKGFITREAADKTLKMQNKILYRCESCLRQYNIIHAREGAVYKCKHCGGKVKKADPIVTIRADESSLVDSASVKNVIPTVRSASTPPLSPTVKAPPSHKKIIEEHDETPEEVKVAREKPARLRRVGKYILTKELGRGGMGIVYKAYETTLKRRKSLGDIQRRRRRGEYFIDEIVTCVRRFGEGGEITRAYCENAIRVFS